MSSRLALVACRCAHEGPWTVAKGNESKLEVFGLGQAEAVVLVLETSGDSQSFEYSSAGLYAWPARNITRYRVCKVCADESPHLPTTVRVLLNGKHNYENRHEST